MTQLQRYSKSLVGNIKKCVDIYDLDVNTEGVCRRINMEYKILLGAYMV